MNPSSLEEAKELASKIRKMIADIDQVETVICPPWPFIADCLPSKTTENFELGGQTVSVEKERGSFTGEVSAHMLGSLGAKYVILGHSERRKRGETDDMVSKQAANALEAGLKVIVCVGEEERDENGAYLEKLKNQIRGSLANIPAKYAKKIILAYEPVWAIGGTEAMKTETVNEMSLFVKKVFADIFTPEVAVKAIVLYGGSVDVQNASDITKNGGVDGLLIGRESLKAENFSQIVKSVSQI